YAGFLCLVAPAESALRQLRPLVAGAGGMALAAGLAAFQILESLAAHRLSIRRQLSYEIFSHGALAPLDTVSALLWPHQHLANETPHAPLLAVALAVVAVIAAARRRFPDRRILFWTALALFAWLLMMGDHTPLGRVTYHIPILNLFRAPQRHAYEWSFAVAVLAAAGLDEVRGFLAQAAPARRPAWIAAALLGGVAALGVAWWRISGLTLATGETPPGDPTQLITASRSAWLVMKLLFVLSAAAAIAWCCRFRRTPGAGAVLAASIAGGCLLEGFLLVSSWWFPFARPASY